jgi:HlyD family secretion protein
MPPGLKKKLIPLGLAALAIAAGLYAWNLLAPSGPGEGFVSGNGRIEATEIDVATKLAGRIEAILVDEGDFVRAGAPLAQMQLSVLEAQLQEAIAQQQRAINAVVSAEAQVAMSESDHAAAKAVVVQRQAEEEAARRRFRRSETLANQGNVSRQQLDDHRAELRSAQAAVSAAKAQVKAAEAAVAAARAQVVGTHSSVDAAAATVARVQADIEDSELKSPRDGRVQYRVAQPGEVLGAGGTVLNLVDLTDVYMTFFLSETVAGRVRLGSDVRIILDAAPHLVIPAKVSFVASTAQFTPKTVETASERQKLMFRVKARIDPALLRRHLEVVKTGVPGVAWLKIDPDKEWPDELAVKVPE